MQQTIYIDPDSNAGDLAQELSLIGAKLLVRTLDGLEDGLIAPISQDNELATMAHSLARDAGVVDWSLAARDIVNLVRGCTPRPGSFARLKNTVLKLWKACLETEGDRLGEPGEVIQANDSLVIAAGSGAVRLVEIQPESRRRMPASDYVRGAGIVAGDRFDVRFDLP